MGYVESIFGYRNTIRGRKLTWLEPRAPRMGIGRALQQQSSWRAVHRGGRYTTRRLRDLKCMSLTICATDEEEVWVSNPWDAIARQRTQDCIHLPDERVPDLKAALAHGNSILKVR